MKIFNIKAWRGTTMILVFLISLLLGVTASAFEASGYINTHFDVSTSELVPKTENPEVPIYYKSDYSNNILNYLAEERDNLNRDGAAQAALEVEEGVVLLKNDNKALPITANQKIKVTPIGRATVNPYRKSTSGGGSSASAYNVGYIQSLEEVGFVLNPTMVGAYTDDKSPKRSGPNRIVGESPLSIYTDDVKASFADYSEVALVILSREAGESNDMFTNDSEGISGLALHQNERDMLDLVKTYKENGTFKKVIVLINSGNPMEVHWLDDYNVDACLWIGGPGNGAGFRGLAKVLTGQANPSGKLIDTYATNSLSAPAVVNFGEFGYTNPLDIAKLKDDMTSARYYVVQAEGIYVGYKYYETRYEDTLLNQGQASSNVGTWASSGATWNYADEVAYPFGFGLSYTKFTQSLDKVKDNGDGTMSVTVTVKNTGDVAGKSVVQLYAQTPYGAYEKQNLVEKPAVQLVGFEKTRALQPGASEVVNVTFEKYFLASYDYRNAKGYIMSEGNYFLSIGNDAHDALNNILAKKGVTGMVSHTGATVAGDSSKVYTWNENKLDKDTYKFTDNARVTNQLDDADINYWIDDAVTYLTRQNWSGTYPTAPVVLTATKDMITELDGYKYVTPIDSPSVNSIPTGIAKGIKLSDMYGVAIDDPLWDVFISQMSVRELIQATIEQGGIAETLSIQAPATRNGDGPDGIGQIGFANESLMAASWNKEIAAKRGYFMGEDALFSGRHSNWSPGNDTHRTPFGGRNFEYYSEDGNLAYLLTAETCREMEAKGTSAGPKHFFANDQETHRLGVATFGTEQAFREIQLRAFEGAYTKGGATTVMTAFNRVGLTYVGHSDAINNQILRGEWGFIGLNITDAAGQNSYIHTIDSLAYGTDMFCYTGGNLRIVEFEKWIKDHNDGFLLNKVKEVNKNIYFTYAHTNLMNGLSSDFDVVSITPVWQTALITTNVVLGVVTLGAFTMFILSAYGLGKKKEGIHLEN